MVRYLKQTSKDILTLKADDAATLHWHVDAAFAVHPDFKSQTGATLTMGQGDITAISRKQNINTRSSTEAELVAADDMIGPMIWTRNFLEVQGYPIQENVLFQDNKSAILQEKNGRKRMGKRSHHLNIRYCFITDQVEKRNIKINFCPTDKMVANYMSKPLQGKKFKLFRSMIMNIPLMAVQMLICCSQYEQGKEVNGTDRSVLKRNPDMSGRTDKKCLSNQDQKSTNATLFKIGSTTTATVK